MRPRLPRAGQVKPGAGEEAAVRLFVALVPPPPVLAALPALPPALRPSPVGQVHVTLAFLGEVADPAPVADELDGALDGARSLRLRLAGAGAFGQAVWLGVAGDSGALGALAARVQAAVRRGGVDLADRPYRPHLTLGRARGRGTPAEASYEGLASYEGPEACWDRVDLVRSTRSPDGARHEALRRWRLRPDPDDQA